MARREKIQVARRLMVSPSHGHMLKPLERSIFLLLEEEWFSKHLDYVGFLLEVRHALGDVTIRTFGNSDTVKSEILRYLGAEPRALSRSSRPRQWVL